MQIVPGSRLGAYDVVSPLGAGGMGEVYRARDTKLNRDVAIKILPDVFAHDAERVSRFTREAQTLAALNHPNIAQIYGIIEEPLAGGAHVHGLVMEFVDGEDLSATIARAAVPAAEALPIAKQIAEALEAAHEQGIVHRDLKPANIKVRADGTVKVLDFGLAKALGAGGASAAPDLTNSPTMLSPATSTGVILGTAAYMAPEQARGKAVDKRADIWAFGVVLYEMLTGRRAFVGDGVSDVLAAVLTRDVEFSHLPAGVPPGVRTLLTRCLEKDPKRRLRDIGDAIVDLDPGRGTDKPAVDASPGRRPRLAWALGPAALLLVAIVVGATLQIRGGASGPGAPEVATVLQIAAPPATVPLSSSPALSRDGRHVAWVAEDRDGRARVWVYSLDSGEMRQVPGSEGGANVFWSPDARAVGFVAQASLKVVDLSSGAARTIAPVPEVSAGATWDEQGGILFSARYRILRVSPSGGTPTPVAALNPAYHENSVRWPQFLPDGRHFLYVARSGRSGESAAYVGALDGTPRRLFPTESKVAYGPPGRLLTVKEGALVARTFDLRTFAVGADETIIADKVGAQPGSLLGFFSVSANGAVAYFGHSVTPPVQLQWVDRSGAPIAPAGPAGSYSTYRIAPDGQRIVVDMGNERTSARDVWILNPGGTPPTRLTFGGSDDWIPVWSPDGQKVVFMSYRNGVGDLYVKSVAGSAPEEALLVSGHQKVPTDWSRDGRFVAYWSDNADNRGDVWAVAAAPSSPPIPIACSPANERKPRFSPDAAFVAYSSDETGRDEIYVQPFPPTGAKWQVSVGGGVDPSWRGDGQELFFVDPGDRLVGVPVAATAGRFSAGRPHTLFGVAHPGGGAAVYDAAPDGRRFLVRTLVRPEVQPVMVMLNWPARLKR